MDRFDTYRDDRNHRGNNYGRYEGYSRNDEHYQRARNLTDEFEQDYRRHRGYSRDDSNQYRNDHTYNEGNVGNRYEQRRREESNYGGNSGYSDRDRYSGYGSDNRGDNYQEDQERYRRARYRDREQGGNRRAGYLMSYYDDPHGRYSGSGREYSRGGDYGQNYNTGIVNYDRGSRYSGRDYIGGLGTRNVDDRSIPGRRSYLQNRYY